MPYFVKEHQPPPPWAHFKKRSPTVLLIPFFYFNWLADWVVCILSKWAILELLEILGTFSILFATISYFTGASDRLKQKHYQAWQVINSAQGKGGNGGRIDALQELNQDHVSLTAVDAADAYLQGVQLPGAELRRGNFSGSDLRGADLKKANLPDSQLHFANLEGADLSGGDLTGSDFTDADLAGANLTGANLAGLSLERADLHGAGLDGVKNWKQIKTIKGANIFGVTNPPEGFVEWAKKQGAVEAK